MSADQSGLQPRARRVVGLGALAGLLAVGINLAIRSAALALLRESVVPFPLAVGADVLFTLLPCLLGALLFLLLRRTASRPLRWFTVTAAVVLVVSWAAPAALAVRGLIGSGDLVTLLVMHAVPAAAIVIVLRRIGRTSHEKVPRTGSAVASRRFRWFAAALLVVAALPMTPTPSSATPYDALLHRLGPVDQQLMLRQVPLAEAASRLDSALRTDTADYGGIQVSAETGQISLYWHGTLSRIAQQLVQQANRALGGAGRVLVRPARYSQAELDREAYRLVGSTTGGVTVVVAAPMPDAGGIELTVAPEHGAAPRTMPTVASTVRTTITVGSAPVPAFGRFNDGAPFNGGAAILQPGVGECSSGFTVLNGLGQRFLLTAGHCGGAGTQWQTPFGAPIGQTVLTAPQRDAELISANAEPFIYNGGPDGTGQGIGESLAGIQSARRTLAGELICNQGAFSGPRCNIQILSHATITINGVKIQEIKARTRDGSEAIGNGDSGGPVISLGKPGFLVALGINSAEDPSHAVACVGVSPPGRTCSTQMFFNDIADVEPATGTVVAIAPGA
jgi:hypothetical protein